MTDYPFAWLDEIIEVTLNPVKAPVSALQTEQLDGLCIYADKQTRLIEQKLKAKTFTLKNKQEITTVAEHYYLAFRQLLRQAGLNLQHYSQNQALTQAGDEIRAILEASGERVLARYAYYLPNDLSALNATGAVVPRESFKMLFRLSGDQIAILIRAAFEANLIDAPSKRAAYRTITPFLSTERREHLSDDSLRSNAGRPERRDRDEIIMILEKLIAIIRDFR